MAISVKLLRTGTAATANTFVVTAGTGDSGKLQIQYNSSDIYNNLSGSTSDILSGASNTTITIPLNSSNEIPKGVYYFNFVADVGSNDTSTINFQASKRAPKLTPDVDVYAPSFRIDDDTTYTLDNGTVSAATRTLTLQYPQTSSQPNLSASASDTTTDLYISTSNVWTGAMQTTLSYDVTYSVATTTGYDAFTYQESGTGYNNTDIDADNELSDLYTCIENLREQVDAAASKKRSDYASLLTKYTHVCSLAVQFREGVIANNTTDLDEIIADIKAITNCAGAASTSSSQDSKKLYGIGGNSESIQDIVASMFTDATNYGVSVTYNDSTDTVSLEGRALFLNVYNDTGSTLSKGKAVYITGYDSATGLPEVSLASNAAVASAEAVGLIYADIASATSGRALVSGWFEEVDTSSFSIGDRLYLSTSGNLTTTDSAPNSVSQLIATVGEAATAGQLLVQVGSPINFDNLLSGAASFTNLSSRITEATAEAATSSLATTPVEVVASEAGRIRQVHSGVVVLTSSPSGTPSNTMALDLTGVNAATGAASHTLTFQAAESASGTSKYFQVSDGAFDVGEPIYIKSTSDPSGNGWDGNFKVILYHASVTP